MTRQEPVHFKQDDEGEPNNAVLDVIKRPVVIHQHIASTTISPSPTLVALIRSALCGHLDDAWREEEDEGEVLYRVKFDRMDEFGLRIEQAVEEIARHTCSHFGRERDRSS